MCPNDSRAGCHPLSSAPPPPPDDDGDGDDDVDDEGGDDGDDDGCLWPEVVPHTAPDMGAPRDARNGDRKRFGHHRFGTIRDLSFRSPPRVAEPTRDIRTK